MPFQHSKETILNVVRAKRTMTAREVAAKFYLTRMQVIGIWHRHSHYKISPEEHAERTGKAMRAYHARRQKCPPTSSSSP